MELQQWRLCKKEKIETYKWDMDVADRCYGISFVKHSVLQRRVGKILNKPPYGRQNPVDRRYMFWETSAMKS